MNRYDFNERTEAGIQVQTWYDPTYIDPSDLHASDEFGVAAPIIRPFILMTNGVKQAFRTEEQRTKYLDWRIKLEQKKGK